MKDKEFTKIMKRADKFMKDKDKSIRKKEKILSAFRILREASRIKKPVRHCVCGGDIGVNGRLLGYCYKCGLDYTRVGSGNDLQYMPIFNYSQREYMKNKRIKFDSTGY